MVGDYVKSRFEVETVWSSDLQRCLCTAEQIGVPVRPSQTLRELRFGDWEGRNWPELHEEAPALAALFVSGDPAFQAPGGERLGDLVTRGEKFIEEACLRDVGGDVAVVAHGGSLKGLLVALLGLPDSSLGKFHFSNSSVSVIDTVPGLVRLHSLNETSHLADALPMI